MVMVMVKVMRMVRIIMIVVMMVMMMLIIMVVVMIVMAIMIKKEIMMINTKILHASPKSKLQSIDIISIPHMT